VCNKYVNMLIKFKSFHSHLYSQLINFAWPFFSIDKFCSTFRKLIFDFISTYFDFIYIYIHIYISFLIHFSLRNSHNVCYWRGSTLIRDTTLHITPEITVPDVSANKSSALQREGEIYFARALTKMRICTLSIIKFRSYYTSDEVFFSLGAVKMTRIFLWILRNCSPACNPSLSSPKHNSSMHKFDGANYCKMQVRTSCAINSRRPRSCCVFFFCGQTFHLNYVKLCAINSQPRSYERSYPRSLPQAVVRWKIDVPAENSSRRGYRRSWRFIV